MTPYERAAAVIATEHGITDVVFKYIDRMNDVCDSDPIEKIVSEYLADMSKAISKHFESIGRL